MIKPDIRLFKKLGIYDSIMENVEKVVNSDIFSLERLPKHSAYARCGIYILFKKDTVVYIGKSLNIRNRVFTHLSENKKDFDSYSVFECLECDIDLIERGLIDKYLPVFNTDSLTVKNKIRNAV